MNARRKNFLAREAVVTSALCFIKSCTLKSLRKCVRRYLRQSEWPRRLTFPLPPSACSSAMEWLIFGSGVSVKTTKPVQLPTPVFPRKLSQPFAKFVVLSTIHRMLHLLERIHNSRWRLLANDRYQNRTEIKTPKNFYVTRQISVVSDFIMGCCHLYPIALLL